MAFNDPRTGVNPVIVLHLSGKVHGPKARARRLGGYSAGGRTFQDRFGHLVTLPVSLAVDRAASRARAYRTRTARPQRMRAP